MRDLDNNTIKYYQNLQPITGSNIPQFTKDKIGALALTFLNPGQPQASANYRIQGAQSVTVEIYTWLGTFACALPGQSGSYAAGMPQAEMSHIYAQPLYPLILGGNGMTYCYIDSKLYKLTSTVSHFALLPTAETSQSAGGFVNYGLNVYAGDDGNRRKIDMNRSRNETVIHSDWVYEKFIGSLPDSASVVSVEINDFTTADMQRSNGSIVAVAPGIGMRTVLKQVTFTGNTLTLGAPEPVSTLDSSSSSPDSSDTSSSSTKSSSSSSKKQSAKSTAASGASSYDSSKFEGEITSTIPAGKSSSRSPAKATTGKAAQKRSSVSSAPPETESSRHSDASDVFPQKEPLEIIRLLPSSPNGGTTPMVSIYIVVMIGLVLVLLVRRK